MLALGSIKNTPICIRLLIPQTRFILNIGQPALAREVDEITRWASTAWMWRREIFAGSRNETKSRLRLSPSMASTFSSKDETVRIKGLGWYPQRGVTRCQ